MTTSAKIFLDRMKAVAAHDPLEAARRLVAIGMPWRDARATAEILHLTAKTVSA